MAVTDGVGSRRDLSARTGRFSRNVELEGNGPNGANDVEAAPLSIGTRLFRGIFLESRMAACNVECEENAEGTHDIDISDDILLGIAPYLDVQSIGRIGQTCKAGLSVDRNLDSMWQAWLQARWGDSAPKLKPDAAAATDGVDGAEIRGQPTSYRDLCRSMMPRMKKELFDIFRIVDCRLPVPPSEGVQEKLDDPASLAKLLAEFKIYIDVRDRDSGKKVLRTVVTPFPSMLDCGIKAVSEYETITYYYQQAGDAFPGRIKVRADDAEAFEMKPPPEVSHRYGALSLERNDENFEKWSQCLRLDSVVSFSRTSSSSESLSETVEAMVTPSNHIGPFSYELPPAQDGEYFGPGFSTDSIISSINVDVPALVLPLGIANEVEEQETNRVANSNVVNSEKQQFFVKGQIVLHLCLEPTKSARDEWKVDSFGFTVNFYETNQDFGERNWPWVLPPRYDPSNSGTEYNEEDERLALMVLQDDMLYCMLSELCATSSRAISDYKSNL